VPLCVLGKGKMVEWTTPFTIGITSGEYLPTPIIPVGIHSQTIGIIIPQSTYNVVGGGGTIATCSLKALLVVYPSCFKNTVATIDLDISNFRLPPHPFKYFQRTSTNIRRIFYSAKSFSIVSSHQSTANINSIVSSPLS